MDKAFLDKVIERSGGFELIESRREILALIDAENKMYGRERKSADHILSFLSAANVSTAMIEVAPGVIELLDKREDRPEFKQSEIAEAAEAVQELLNHASAVESEGAQSIVEQATHVISEAGDVIYNLLQLYALAELPTGDPRKIDISELALAGIENLFYANPNASLAKFMTVVGTRKFQIRYYEEGHKNVEKEESMLVNEFGSLTLEIIDAHGGLSKFVEAIRQLIFNFYAACINATNGREHIHSQMLGTAAILSQIYESKEA